MRRGTNLRGSGWREAAALLCRTLERRLLLAAMLALPVAISAVDGVCGEPHSVRDMAELRSYDAAAMANTGSYWLEGYYAGNPSGSGRFVWVPAAQARTLVSDDGVIVAPRGASSCSLGCLRREVSDGVYSTDMWGIVGDSKTDNTRKLQEAIDLVQASRRGRLRFTGGDACIAAGPLTITNAITVYADNETYACILGVGLKPGQFLLTVNGTGRGTSGTGVHISNIILRSDNKRPNGLLITNMSVSSFDVYFYDIADQVTIRGNRTFSDRLHVTSLYGVTGKGIYFEDYRGGGQIDISGSSLSGTDCLYIDADSFVSDIAADGVNFESCRSSAISVAGTVRGLSGPGLRVENSDGRAAFWFCPRKGQIAQGISITGGDFTTQPGTEDYVANFGGCGGQVSGVIFAANSVYRFATAAVHLTPDLSGAVIAANRMNSPFGGRCTPIADGSAMGVWVPPTNVCAVDTNDRGSPGKPILMPYRQTSGAALRLRARR